MRPPKTPQLRLKTPQIRPRTKPRTHMRTHRRHHRQIFRDQWNITDFRRRDKWLVLRLPIRDLLERIVQVDPPTQHHPMPAPRPVINTQPGRSTELVSLAIRKPRTIWLVRIDRRHLHLLHHRSQPRVPTDVRKWHNLLIEINLPRRRERLTDRIRLHNGHPKKIQQQVIRWPPDRTPRMIRPTWQVGFRRTKEQCLPRLILHHPRRQRSQHHRRGDLAIRRKKGVLPMKRIFRLIKIPNVGRRILRKRNTIHSPMPMPLRPLVGLVAKCSVRHKRWPVIPVPRLPQRVHHPVNPRRNIWPTHRVETRNPFHQITKV